MVLKKQDYSNLLLELMNIANSNYQNDEKVFVNSMFAKCYCYAYMRGVYNQDNFLINKDLVDEVLSNHKVFNYFINTCIMEYNIYGEVGSGKITYAPYQRLADFFFEDENRKEILINYLQSEIKDVFNIEKAKIRVKK